MPVPAASDDVLLAQLDALPGNEDLPSIRALMRDHGIGQARATRIHREATARRERRHSAADLGGRGQAAPPDRSTPTPERHEPTGQSEQPEPAADVAKEQRAPYDDDTDEAHETDHQDEHQVSRTTTEEESEESPIKIHN